MRFQQLMPDVLHWLGIRKIHRLVSMSNMKYDAITGSGIEVVERVNIPDELIPADARVEMDAKMAAGYFTPGAVPDAEELKKAKGRGLDAERSGDCCAPPQPCASALPPAGAGPAGESAWFTVDDAAWTQRRRGGGRHARAVPHAGHSVPQPLAPL
jgi:hypothetical protein